MKISWEVRPFKERARKKVAEKAKPGKTHLLVMPSSSGRDVKLLLEHGVPSKSARWTVVERNADKLSAFKERGFLEDFTKVDYCRKALHKVVLDDPVDFAWFDLCGNLTKNDLKWLETLCYKADSDLFFTLTLAGGRGNLLFNELKKLLPKEFPEAFSALVESHKNKIIEAQIDTKFVTTLITQLVLLKSCFSGNISCSFYQDTVPMALFHIQNPKPASKEEINIFVKDFINDEHLIQQSLKGSEIHIHRFAKKVKMVAKTTKDDGKFTSTIKKKFLISMEKLFDSAIEEIKSLA